jgi:predicted enzyme related to lactoylglutathione lyase
MITMLKIVGIMVRDQDEALRFYTEKLGFVKRTDLSMGSMRWLTISPSPDEMVEIALIIPDPAMHGEERAQVLDAQIGKSPTWSYSVDDCRKTYEELLAKGVKFQSKPEEQPYGIEAVCEDLYGNTISLVQPAAWTQG